jgi:hypothetical protein
MAVTTTTSSTLHTQFWAPKVNHPQSQTTTIYNPNSKPLIHHHSSAMARAGLGSVPTPQASYQVPNRS